MKKINGWGMDCRAKLVSPRQRGDTLVEVLISILIVSMVLTGAYVTTNRSSLAVRDSQEHGEALKLAQGQLEQVRQNASEPTAPVFMQAVGNQFCMVNAVITTGGACIRDAADQQAAAGVQPAFRLSVQRSTCAPEYSPPAPSPPCNKFTIRVTWDSVTTDGQAFEQIITRLYQ